MFDPSSGSQNSDVNGGISSNGLFWIVQVRDNQVKFKNGVRGGRDTGGVVAKASVRGLAMVENYVFFGTDCIPATVNIDVTWRFDGPLEAMGTGNGGDLRTAYLGKHAKAVCEVHAACEQIGLTYETNALTSQGGWASVGNERNGSFA